MSPLPTRDHLFKEVLSRAVASPVSLFLGATGLLLLPGPAWPLGVGTLALEGVWLWIRIRDPEQAKLCSEEMVQRHWRDLIQRLDRLSASLDAQTAETLTGIVEAQERLLSLYTSSEQLLPNTRLELTSLLAHCLSLAEKRHQLHTHLSNYRGQDLQRDAIQLERKLERSPDPITRELYQQALDQKQQELQNFVRLHEAVSRIDGQLTAVRCSFDNTLSKVMCLQAADSAADPNGDERLVYEDLHRLARGVEALEASLVETLSFRGAA